MQSLTIYTLTHNKTGEQRKAVYCNQGQSVGHFTETEWERYVDINNGQVITSNTYSIAHKSGLALAEDEMAIVEANLEAAKNVKSIKKSIFA